MLEFIALGGTLDRKKEKPSIGGTSNVLLHKESSTAIVSDFGAYHLSAEERARQTEIMLQLEVPKIEEIGPLQLPILPMLQSRILSDNEFAYLAEATATSCPDVSLLRNVRNIYLIGTHAHADHIGLLPYFKAQFPRAHVMMTRPTLELSLWSWKDTLKIADREGHKILFNFWDINNCQKEVKIINVGDTIAAGPFTLEIFSAGHILGAVSVLVKFKSESSTTRIFFTNDISLHDQRSVAGATLPAGKIEYLISESTYAGRDQPDRVKVEQELVRDIEECLENGGKVLCPTLAVGRSSELFQILLDHGITKRYEVYIDGAACETNRIYESHGAVDQSVLEHFVSQGTAERSRIIRSKKPLVMIAPSGMLTGGHAVEYAIVWGPDPKNLICLSSYQDPCSPGHQLTRVSPGQRVSFFENTFTFNAQVKKYILSAHVDGKNLVELVDRLSPQETYLVHGVEGNMEMLAAQIGRNVYKTYIEEPVAL